MADASHELRSPLAAIRTALEVGLAHPDTAPWPDIAQCAALQSERLESLVQQLLVLAKGDDRQLAASRRPVDLAGLVEDVRATSAATEIAVEVRAEHAVVLGDPNSRMVHNTLDNAVRHAEHRVLTVVTTGRIEIADDGPGIPPEERERVFDRFVRLDASRERVSGSNGLGLATFEQVDRPVVGQIDQDRAIDAAASDREVVDPEDLDGADDRVRKRPHRADQRVPPDRQPDHDTKSGRTPAGQHQPKLGHQLVSRDAASRVSAGQSVYLLGKRACRTGSVAEEPSYRQLYDDRLGRDRQIGQSTPVTTVDST